MKKSLLTIFLVLFVFACAPKEAPKEAAAPEPSAEYATQTTIMPGEGILIEQAAQVTAIVLNVDRSARSITIKNPEGEISEVKLTDDVRNFDQIDPGDEIVLEVYSALALMLAKPGEEFTDRTSNAVAVAQPGDKPMFVNVDMVEALCEITAINRDTREITVTGPRGNSITLTVPPDIEQFDERKVGEKVNARYVEAFAIAVEEVQ